MQKKLEKQKGTGSFVQTIEQKASFVSRPSTKGQKRKTVKPGTIIQ